MPTLTREINLAARPCGELRTADLRLIDTTLADPVEGEVLVQNLVMSVDPYMRPRMDDRPSYVPPYQVGAPLDGSAVGVVELSRASALPVGSLIAHGRGWREHAIIRADEARLLRADEDLPMSYHLGLLGGPGLTAYAGLRKVAAFDRGDSVYVSAGAGAVGSLAGQFARHLGATRVVGSAGSDAKVRYMVDRLGFDDAFNYTLGGLADQIHTAMPSGIDVYFDNVGGEHLAAALDAMNTNGRIAMCGAISTYNAERTASTFHGDLFQVIARRLTLRGFISTDFAQLRSEFETTVRQWFSSGDLEYVETIESGIENAPRALISLLNGGNVGKMVVRLKTDAAEYIGRRITS